MASINYWDHKAATLTTSNAVQTTLLTYTPPNANCSGSLVAYISLKGPTGDGGAITLTIAYKSVAGVTSIVGVVAAAVSNLDASLALAAATAVASGGDILTKCTGVGVLPIDWTVRLMGIMG